MGDWERRFFLGFYRQMTFNPPMIASAMMPETAGKPGDWVRVGVGKIPQPPTQGAPPTQ